MYGGVMGRQRAAPAADGGQAAPPDHRMGAGERADAIAAQCPRLVAVGAGDALVVG